MKVNVDNIPNDKFAKIQNKIFKLLHDEGLECEDEPISLEDGLTNEFQGFEFVIKKRKCAACNGSGYYDSADEHGHPIFCDSCNGSGYEVKYG